MIPNWIIVISIAFSSQIVKSQIPLNCCNKESFMERSCCPDNCGEDVNRGSCVDITVGPQPVPIDIRENWPHFFTHVCLCKDNYTGVN